MINMQQLFVMLALLQINMPDNVANFFKSIFSIAAFDFYDTNDVLHEWLEIPPTEPFGDRFEQLGFESKYVLNNMGTMAIFYLVYMLLMIIQKCIHSGRHTCNCAKNMSRSLRHLLYYNLILTTVFESYSIICICCLIAYTDLSYSSWGLVV